MGVTLASRIALLERQLVELRQQECAEQLATIARCVGGHVFNAAELLRHAAFDAALSQALAGLATPRQVGRRLRQLARVDGHGVRLVCLPRNGDGCIWCCEYIDPLDDGGGTRA
jgi:hypothetical protein